MRFTEVIASILLGGLLLHNCAPFKAACDKATPVLLQAQSYGFEANLALDDARRVIEASDLSPSGKKDALQAIQVAQSGLKAASQSLAAASSACNTPDPVSVFETFVVAWKTIRGFLSLVGSESGVHNNIQDPTIYSIAQRRAH